MQARTKDEHFIIAVYQSAEEFGDPFHVVNRYEVGNKIHLHPRAVNTICQLLIQANFIKKQGPEDIYLTPHGKSLVDRLLSEM